MLAQGMAQIHKKYLKIANRLGYQNLLTNALWYHPTLGKIQI